MCLLREIAHSWPIECCADEGYAMSTSHDRRVTRVTVDVLISS